MSDVKTFQVSERCQGCGALKREHLGFALVCPPLPDSRPVDDQRDVREPQGAPQYAGHNAQGECIFCGDKSCGNGCRT